VEGQVRGHAGLATAAVLPRHTRLECRPPVGRVWPAAVDRAAPAVVTDPVALVALALPATSARDWTAIELVFNVRRICSTVVQGAIRKAAVGCPPVWTQQPVPAVVIGRFARCRPRRQRARAFRSQRLDLRSCIRRRQGPYGLARPVDQGLGRRQRSTARDDYRRAPGERALHCL